METPKGSQSSTGSATPSSGHIGALPLTAARQPTCYSEHGHRLTRIQPMSNHSGASVATFFTGLFTTNIGISTLGTSVTFSYVISANPDKPSYALHNFGTAMVQTFLSTSWLLFLLALVVGSLASTMLTFFRAHWIEDWDGLRGETSRRSVQVYASLISALLGSLIVAAFVFLCLVVTAYSPIIGWIALGFIGSFGLFILSALVYQAPWWWRTNRPAVKGSQNA